MEYNIENAKSAANEVFGAFEKHNSGKCSYDRALEDAGRAINKYADERQIVGYATSGRLKELLNKIWESKKVNEKESYLFDCKIHRNEMDLLERILKSIS